jgi:hypothetical protein
VIRPESAQLSPPDPACPLCGKPGPLEPVAGPAGSKAFLCDRCWLIFRAMETLPDLATERSRYLFHENGPQFPAYVAFLRQAITPTLPHLRSGMRGLDYGCGPTPTLSLLVQAEGYDCGIYDPFFFPELPVGPFDFVFATEVVEHFNHPGAQLARICGLLLSGGILTIMTDPWTSVAVFATWGYAMDPTHVCFFHARTIDFICAAYGLEALDRRAPRVSVLRKA